MQNQDISNRLEAVWQSAEEAAAAVEQRLQEAARLRGELVGVQGERTVANTLELFNDLLIEIDRVFGWTELIGNVHPDAAVREAALNGYRKLAQFVNDLKLDRDLYEALNGIDTTGLDPETSRFLSHTLRDYRRAGVDRPEEVRRELAGIYREMVVTGQEFSKNIREGERYILIRPSETGGLPADFVQAHPPGEDGLVKITTAYTDYDVFMKYADREDLRRELYMQFQTRAYPVNAGVLSGLLALRHRYAGLLGYPSWAEYSAEDKMVGKAEVISAFIDRVAEMARPRVQQDLAAMLERKKQDHPGAERVNDWDYSYYVRIVRAEKFGVDEQKVRTYFEYQRVKNGLLELSAELFGLEFRAVSGAPVWAPEVEALDVYDAGSLIGRVYLDLFPRPDKYSHMATFPGQTGLAGRQLAQVALVGNFPGPGTSQQPAFWEHHDVDTFLHEFGHILHTLLSGRHHWAGIAGLNCQWDFVEVPSQLYEEWAWEPAVLGRFARHFQSGEAVPADLVERMYRASGFAKGIMVNRQMSYARLSLFCHDHDPAESDVLESWQQICGRYSPFPYQPGTHTYASFGHLEGYGSMYYCYMWSLALVKDLFTRFRSAGLMDPRTAADYRRTVLEPGGARDGDEMVKDFLGREYTFESFRRWLEE